MGRNGIRVISISKPGYGGSSRQVGRRVCDANQWAEHIANALGIDKFSVFGRSGGGPHALAVARYLPDRVKKVVALSSPSPFDPNDPVWSMNMSEGNKRAAALVAAGDTETLWQGYEEICHKLQDDPMALLDALEKDTERPLPLCDRMMLTPQMKFLVGRAHQFAARNGPAGWVDDNVANFNPPERGGWCIEDLEKIQCPALLAGHEQAPYTPFEHARRLVAAIGKNAILLRGSDSHFTNLDSIHYLKWLTIDSPEDRNILAGIAEELRDWSLLRSLRSDVRNP